jgi:hypothetical protein
MFASSKNVIERAVLICDGAVIHGHHLPPTSADGPGVGTFTRLSLEESIAAYEKDLIQDGLKTARGNRAKAARLLGTTERIFNYKVRKVRGRCRSFPRITTSMYGLLRKPYIVVVSRHLSRENHHVNPSDSGRRGINTGNNLARLNTDGDGADPQQ